MSARPVVASPLLRLSAWTPYLPWAMSVTAVVLALAGLSLIALDWGISRPYRFGPPGYPAIFAVSFGALGIPIATRHPRNAIGWLFCGAGLLYGAQVFSEEYATFAYLASPLPGGEYAAWVVSWIWLTALAPLILLLLLFPDGRLLSRRWRPLPWLVGTGVLLGVLGLALAPGTLLNEPYALNPFAVGDAGTAPFFSSLLGLGTSIVAVTMFGAAISLVVRARRASGIERQQLKWLGYASVLVVVSFTFVLSAIYSPAAQLAFLATLAGIPLSAGIAILRYRLYDIDVLIRRTLVYGAVSGTLVAAYVALVVLFQAALRPLTGGSELAVAGSTLAVVALFQPLRRRVQELVDRRFYRSRYDAARTLDALVGRLRNEVDLDAVRRDVLDVVDETLRPAHGGVWLRRR